MHRERAPRPKTVVAFEVLYLASLTIGTVNAVTMWSRITRSMGAEVGTAGSIQLIVTLLGGTCLSLMLCLFASRRGSLAATWTLLAFFAFSTFAHFSLPMELFGQFGLGAQALYIAWGLNGVALVMIFMPDAQKWLESGC